MLRTKLAPALAALALLPMSAMPSACMIQDQSGGQVMTEPNQEKSTKGNTSLVQIGEELRGELDGAAFQISASPGGLRVTVAGDALFVLDSTTLLSDARRDLQIIAARLIAGPSGVIGITGHTDDQGDPKSNQAQSLRQASAVADIFRAAGFRDFFIQVHGRGESVPVASNRTPEGRSRNYRIEIVFRANVH